MSSINSNRNRLNWSWSKGAATGIEDFGDPVNGATSYRVCIYDEVAGAATLKFGAFAPAGGLCKDGKACWKATTNGYAYVDANLTPDGLLRIILKAGTEGLAHHVVRGAGSNLLMLAPPGLGLFEQDTKVTAQLIKDDASVCWESVYSAPARKNTMAVFRDTLP